MSEAKPWLATDVMAPEIAVAVEIEAQKDGVAPKVSEEELRRIVADTQWTPAYASVPKEEHR